MNTAAIRTVSPWQLVKDFGNFCKRKFNGLSRKAKIISFVSLAVAAVVGYMIFGGSSDATSVVIDQSVVKNLVEGKKADNLRIEKLNTFANETRVALNRNTVKLDSFEARFDAIKVDAKIVKELQDAVAAAKQPLEQIPLIQQKQEETDSEVKATKDKISALTEQLGKLQLSDLNPLSVRSGNAAAPGVILAPQTQNGPVATEVTGLSSDPAARRNRAIRDCQGVWTPSANVQEEQDKFNRMQPDGYNLFIQDCMSARTQRTWKQEDKQGEIQMAGFRKPNYRNRPMYQGDRELLELESLGPRGRVIKNRPAPVGAIPCVVRGIVGKCVQR